MITNLVETILTVSLATNVTISPETRSVPIPCPDGRIGCLVYHSKDEPTYNPRWRTVETKVVRIRKTSIPSLGKSWDEEEVVSEDVRFETRSEAWVVDQERTERLRAGGVLLTIGGELPMVTAPMKAHTNTTWSADATNAAISVWTNSILAGVASLTNVWVSKNEVPWETSTNDWRPRLLQPGAEVQTIFDDRGRFRPVGTNMGLSGEGFYRTWRYEVTP